MTNVNVSRRSLSARRGWLVRSHKRSSNCTISTCASSDTQPLLRFVLDRPAGADDGLGSGWLEPDLPIPDAPLDPRAAIDAIAAETAARNTRDIRTREVDLDTTGDSEEHRPSPAPRRPPL